MGRYGVATLGPFGGFLHYTLRRILLLAAIEP